MGMITKMISIKRLSAFLAAATVILLAASGCKRNGKTPGNSNSAAPDSSSAYVSDAGEEQKDADPSASSASSTAGAQGNTAASSDPKTQPEDTVDVAEDIFDDGKGNDPASSAPDKPSKPATPSESNTSSDEKTSSDGDKTSGGHTPAEDEDNKSDGEYSKRY